MTREFFKHWRALSSQLSCRLKNQEPSSTNEFARRRFLQFEMFFQKRQQKGCCFSTSSDCVSKYITSFKNRGDSLSLDDSWMLETQFRTSFHQLLTQEQLMETDEVLLVVERFFYQLFFWFLLLLLFLIISLHLFNLNCLFWSLWNHYAMSFDCLFDLLFNRSSLKVKSKSCFISFHSINKAPIVRLVSYGQRIQSLVIYLETSIHYQLIFSSRSNLMSLKPSLSLFRLSSRIFTVTF